MKVCVFDAYGTLFDVNAPARRYAKENPEAEFSKTWSIISSEWREKQLSYTWLLNSMGYYKDFWSITEHALEYTLELTNLSKVPELKCRLLNFYQELDSFPEVPKVLRELKEMGIVTAILSNGTRKMIASAIEASGIQQHIDKILSVEDVAIYKPNSRVYNMVTDTFNVEKREVLLVSSNGWDISGAAHFGFNTFWVNRNNLPVERLLKKPDDMGPDLFSVKTHIDQHF